MLYILCTIAALLILGGAGIAALAPPRYMVEMDAYVTGVFLGLVGILILLFTGASFGPI